MAVRANKRTAGQVNCREKLSIKIVLKSVVQVETKFIKIGYINEKSPSVFFVIPCFLQKMVILGFFPAVAKSLMTSMRVLTAPSYSEIN